jgi:hypothetical protein
MPIRTPDYTPPAWLTSGHLQTLYATLVRRVDYAYDRRERIDTPDGDFLDLDWAMARDRTRQGRAKQDGATPDGAAQGVAVLSHGLEGSADRQYMRGMARALVRRGWNVCAWNLRGCSGTPNRQVRTYHSGATDDLDTVVQHLFAHYGYERVALVGFSLGGNLTLKYLGERGRQVDDRIRRAAAFSVPVDLAAGSRTIGRWSNWHYTQYFLRSLRAKVEAKAEQHPDRISTKPFRTISTLTDFDDAYTAPLNGFRDAADYYRQASSKPLLPHIAVPTLLVNAQDDPFLPPSCYPTEAARDHAHLTLEMPEHGGHVGFVTRGDDGEYWSEQRAAQFLGRSAPGQETAPTKRADERAQQEAASR